METKKIFTYSKKAYVRYESSKKGMVCEGVASISYVLGCSFAHSSKIAKGLETLPFHKGQICNKKYIVPWSMLKKYKEELSRRIKRDRKNLTIVNKFLKNHN